MMKHLQLSALAGFVCLAVAGTGNAAGLAPAGDLVLHRAVYDLRLDPDSKGGGGLDVMGRIVYELGATCDDYLMNQRVVTRSPVGGGRSMTTDTRAVMLESRDGSNFRFNMQTYHGDKLSDEFVGRAKLVGKNGAGQASYKTPTDLKRELPTGAVFPVTMSRRMLAAAREGVNHSEIVIFDGSKVGLYRVVVFIGAKQEPDAALAKTFPVFRDQAWWTMQAAYYLIDDNAATPVFEFGSRLYDNGASSHIVLDYGAVKLNGEISNATVMPAPDCR